MRKVIYFVLLIILAAFCANFMVWLIDNNYPVIMCLIPYLVMLIIGFIMKTHLYDYTTRQSDIFDNSDMD